MEGEKLQKVLARLGLGSRRSLEQIIAQGRVEVDGRKAQLGDRIGEGAEVRIDGQVVLSQGQASAVPCRVLMYYKKEGDITTQSDPEGRPTVFDRLPEPGRGRWIYVGRLDINSSGLLLMTTDGELANALMHPSSEIERVYAVRVFGDVSDEDLQRLKKGVMLEDGPARFEDIVYAGGEGSNRWYHVTLKEGRKREVRRLFEGIGRQVSRLIRIKYGNISLDPRLSAGEYRELTLSEINNLRDLAGLAPLEKRQFARTPLEDPAKTAHARGRDRKAASDTGDSPWGSGRRSKPKVKKSPGPKIRSGALAPGKPGGRGAGIRRRRPSDTPGGTEGRE